MPNIRVILSEAKNPGVGVQDFEPLQVFVVFFVLGIVIFRRRIKKALSMANIFKKYERVWFIVLLVITFVCFGFSFFGFLLNSECTPKLVLTTGLFAVVTGVVQLEISGLFEKVIEECCSEEKHPSGPPSYLLRQIVDNPDTPVRTWIRNKCFFEVRTGFWFIVIGTLFQVLGVWL